MPFENITVSEAAELLLDLAPEHRADWAAALDQSDDWGICRGRLDDEHYSPDGAVIVDGDVALSGDLFVSEDDVLIVLGSVECELADLRGEVLIVGNLAARSFVYANSGNNYGLGVVGTMRTKLFVEEGMATSAKEFDCEVWRTMNAVVQVKDGHRFEKLPSDATTRDRARKILGGPHLLELLDRATLQPSEAELALQNLEEEHGFEFRPYYEEFLLTLAPAGTGTIDYDELPAWPGVVDACNGTGTDDIEEETESYWCSDVSYLHSVDTFADGLDDHGWSPRLLHHGYVIGHSFGGDVFIQASDGAIYMLYHDEWDEDFVDEMVEMDMADAIEAAVGNWVADDFATFYRVLCSIRGAKDLNSPGEARATIEALESGETHTLDRVDWDFVGGLVGLDFEEHDELVYYLLDRDMPVVFIKGDVRVDGNCDPRGFPHGLELVGEDIAVVIVGDLVVAGNLDLDESCPLVVTGSLDAGSITNGYGALLVGGTLRSEFVFLDTSDQGGVLHASECYTHVLIDAGRGMKDFPTGDYLTLSANRHSPRQKYTLTRALTELGLDLSDTTPYFALKSLGEERNPKRIEGLVELLERHFEARPEHVPDHAKWNRDFSCYTLRETDEDGELHGRLADWEADGTPKKLRSYHHGTPHGEWLVNHGGRLYPQHFEHGKRQRPDSVPDDAFWLEDGAEWEQSGTDDHGKKHGDVRWWRPDGTLCCETHYEHGLAQGEGRRFHESGETSQIYTFVDGKLHGERIWYRAEGFTTESAMTHFPDRVARVVAVYHMGNERNATCYDRDGNVVDLEG